MINSDAKVERILKVAKIAFFEAIDMRACIEALEASNQSNVSRSLDDAKAALAAELIQKALFGRLLMEVMTAFDPEKQGDFHLKVGMNLIRQDVPRKIVLQRGGKIEDIEAAERCWTRCLNFEPFERLRTYRNKFVAHLSDSPAGMKDPIISELFDLARMTAEVAENLAHGTGVATVSLESQVMPHQESSRAFWAPWRTK